jgi:hypothetical protein
VGGALLDEEGGGGFDGAAHTFASRMVASSGM